MTNSDACWQDSERFLAGDMDAAERTTFLRHAAQCPDCSGLVELDERFRHKRVDDDDTALTVGEGARLRGAVLRELRARTVRRRWLPRYARAAAAALLLVAAGFAAGRGLARSPADNAAALLRRIQDVARRNQTVADVANSPYILTNVAFSRVNDTEVSVSFDATSHLEVTADRSDPLVRELVVQAVLNQSAIGSRLEAIDYAGDVRDRAVVKALQIAMLNDPNAAVRLKALTALAPHKNEPAVQASLIEVLKTADSVPMRLQAIDYLVDGRVDKEAIRGALPRLQAIGDEATLVRANAYLQGGL